MTDDDTRDLIIGIRGGEEAMPSKCDWCGKPCKPDELEPEEAGDWVCRQCWEAPSQLKEDRRGEEA